MKKRDIVWSVVLVVIVVLIIGSVIAGWYAFSLLASEDGGGVSGGRSSRSEVRNPVEDLTDEDAEARFDSSFVHYLLFTIGASNLHEPPLSDDLPRIEIRVGEKAFGAEIEDGDIAVSEGELAKEDIIISTSTSEAIKMLRNKAYVKESFENGGSSIELVASKTKLAAKGYLKIYTELTGDGVTGAVIRGFSLN